jgi:uncharacterized protein (TIGR02246 family)
MRKLLILTAALLLIAAAPAWQRETLAAAAPFIDKANEEWTRAIVKGDAAMMAAPYDANAVFIAPDGSEIRGRDAVQAMYAKPRAAKVLNASIKSDGRAAADPDDVYEWGSATMSVERDGKTTKASGRYLTVWHRSARQWVITHNIAF